MESSLGWNLLLVFLRKLALICELLSTASKINEADLFVSPCNFDAVIVHAEENEMNNNIKLACTNTYEHSGSSIMV
jgi:hypothetical protein